MESFKTNTLVDWVEKQIINDIEEKKLTSGVEISNEMEMAEKYGVGRNVVREAISRLRMLGIIDSRKRRGMVVSEPDVMANFQKVVNPHILSKDTILDLLAMRVSLEIGSASIIINNITDQDIDDLKKIVAREAATTSQKVDIEMEKAFHSKIYAISKNRIMQEFLNIIIPVFRYVNENFADFDEFNKQRQNKKRYIRHADLIPFLEARDVEGYQRAVEDHLIAYVDYINNENNKGANPLNPDPHGTSY